MKKIIAIMMLFMPSLCISDQPVQAVDLRDHNLSGTVKAILAPNLIELRTKVDGYEVAYWVEPAFIAWGDVKGIECPKKSSSTLKAIKSAISKDVPPTQLDRQKKRVEDGCNALEHLVGEDVDVEVVRWTSTQYSLNPVFVANIFHNGQSVGYQLVAAGTYQVDAAQTRDYTIVGQQKQPDCIKHMSSQGLEKFERSNLTCMRFAR